MKVNNPILSILLPAYNASNYIREAIESILEQTFSDFELIIADDGSLDDTRIIIDSYNDDRIIASHNQVNCGKTKTINRISGLARGEYLTIHDADDISLPERFESQIDFLKKHSEYGICGTAFETVSEDGSHFSFNIPRLEHDDILNNLSEGSQFHGPTVVVRKMYVDRLKTIYREYFENNFEDIDFCYRILSLAKGHNLGKVLYRYRIVHNSLCRKNVTIKNRNLYQVVLHLYRQREGNELDDLDLGKPENVDVFFDEITECYRLDKAQIHREAASYLMYWKLRKRAIAESLKAVRKRPFELINYRTLIYCIRAFL